MAGIMGQAVARLTGDVQRFLSVAFVSLVAWELGLCWRETALALPNLLAWFARQILGGNGKPWTEYNKDKETIALKGPTGTVAVTAQY